MSMSSEVPSFNLIFVGVVVFFLLDDVQSIGQEEVDRVDRGQTEAEGNRDAGEYLGHTQNIGNCGLENTSDIEEVIGILRADNGKHDEDGKLKDADDEHERFLCLAMQQVDDDVNAEVGMLAVSVGAADENRPDKQARDYLLAPLKRRAEHVAHDDVQVNYNDTGHEGRAGNDSVEVFQYVLKGYFFLH